MSRTIRSYYGQWSAHEVFKRQILFRMPVVIKGMDPGIRVFDTNGAIQFASQALREFVEAVLPAADVGQHGDMVVFLQNDPQKVGAAAMQPVLFYLNHGLLDDG